MNILDPATGTGTFITNLMTHLPADQLEYKYLNEIHANEVEVLPYYIANLNIEYTYKELTGGYLGFPNLCFVDTLDNMNWKGASGAAVQRQTRLNLGSVSEENWIRVQEQNEKPISVIMGNPPYNDQQSNWYDDNPNRKYPEIDKRIRETYVKASVAQRTHQYDMYKRFIRWASDRLEDDGIIGFITNRAYLDTRQDDGFRQLAGQEFTDIYILDLGSDVRRNPKISGTTHNVFGIQTGVAIGFFVREKAKLGDCGVHYARREDAELAADKLAFLRKTTIEGIDFDFVVPDAKSNWLYRAAFSRRRGEHPGTGRHRATGRSAFLSGTRQDLTDVVVAAFHQNARVPGNPDGCPAWGTMPPSLIAASMHRPFLRRTCNPHLRRRSLPQ